MNVFLVRDGVLLTVITDNAGGSPRTAIELARQNGHRVVERWSTH
jgi:hypothetical protein